MVVIDALSMIYLVVFLCILYVGVPVEFCVREFVWRENHNIKRVIFYDILYHLNIIFLQHVFEALNNFFSYSKTTRKECTKVHSIFTTHIKELENIFLMV
jgi:hypothetical protein